MRQPHNEVDASEAEEGDPGLPPLRTIDLFAGCGGLTQGFVDAKYGGRPVYRPVAAVELDRAAAATYAVNFTEKFGAHIHQGDIADWVDRPRGLPEADIVLGGPPCQGFSRLGNQDPNDARNQLWRHYLDVVSTVRPMAFVMENVDAFRNSPNSNSCAGKCVMGEPSPNTSSTMIFSMLLIMMCRNGVSARLSSESEKIYDPPWTRLV